MNFNRFMLLYVAAFSTFVAATNSSADYVRLGKVI